MENWNKLTLVLIKKSARSNKNVQSANKKNTYLLIFAVEQPLVLIVIQSLKNKNVVFVATIGLLSKKQGNRYNNCNQSYPSVIFLQPKCIDVLSIII